MARKLGLLGKGTNYKTTCDPDTSSGKLCLEGLPGTRRATSLTRAKGGTVGVVAVPPQDSSRALQPHKAELPPQSPAQLCEGEKTASARMAMVTATGRARRHRPRTSSTPLWGVSRMIFPVPDPPPTAMRFPIAPKFTSLLETMPPLFPECAEAHAVGLLLHPWANLYSSVSVQNMLNLAAGA